MITLLSQSQIPKDQCLEFWTLLSLPNDLVTLQMMNLTCHLIHLVHYHHVHRILFQDIPKKNPTFYQTTLKTLVLHHFLFHLHTQVDFCLQIQIIFTLPMIIFHTYTVVHLYTPLFVSLLLLARFRFDPLIFFLTVTFR